MSEKRIDAQRTLGALALFIRELGRLALVFGEEETKSGIIFVEFFKRISEDKEFMDKFVSQVPPDILGSFIKIIFIMQAISPKMSNLMGLPPEDKIKIGTQLNELAKEIEMLAKKLGEKA